MSPLLLMSHLLLPWLLLGNAAHGLDVRFRGRTFVQSTSPELPPYLHPELPSDPGEPRNIHLAFGATELQLVVTWSTGDLVSPALVRYRPVSRHHQAAAAWRLAKGWSTRFVDGGQLKATQFVHRVVLADLSAGQWYEYSVGNGSNASIISGWSSSFEFRVPSGGNSGGRSFAIFGDFGLQNAQSLPRLFDDAIARRRFDAIIHVGDFAYDMPDDNGRVGDQFMQMLQPIAARLQYMTCVGNHEEKYNFSHYKARFSMPWSGENGSAFSESSMFYSVNIGPVHLVSISNEFYFFTNYGSEQIARQYSWLEADLRLANANRTAAPWLVLVGHRPMYCSNNSTRDCDWGAATLRSGVGGHGLWALEPLMLRFGVDLAFWGHEHSYERTWPVRDGRPVVARAADPYWNPLAPVHIVTGSAGNKERHAYFTDPAPAFSARRSTDYGYTRVRFANASHAFVEQVSDDRAGAVIDSFVLVQERHGPFVED